MFEQVISNRARILEGITFGPYELFFDIFEGIEAFPAIDAAQVYLDMELLHAAKQRFSSLEELEARLEQVFPIQQIFNWW